MPTNHDINIYLHEWMRLEPSRCQHVMDDHWTLVLNNPPPDVDAKQTCDVVTFHGVGRVEDVIREAIRERMGWTIDLIFDRGEETFKASTTNDQGDQYAGIESLNPGVALLSAYLPAIRH